MVAKRQRWTRRAAAAGLAGALLGLAAPALGALTGAGSTFAAPAYTKWCGESGLCNYLALGSTAGLNAIGDREVDFAGSDATPAPDQLARIKDAAGGAPPLYFPTLLGGISIPTHLSGVSTYLRFDPDALGRIFAGGIVRWNDPAIARSNPGLRLPNAPITACVRADGSGTSAAFSRYLAQVSPSFRTMVGVSQTPGWRAPHLSPATGSQGVVGCVHDQANSIGYVDLRDAVQDGMGGRISAIGQSGPGSGLRADTPGRGARSHAVYVRPNSTSIAAAGNLRSVPPNLLVDLSNSTAPGAYPITITTWIVAYGDYAKAGRDLTGVRDWLDYVYSDRAQGQLADLGYARLPPPLLAAARAQMAELD